MEDFNAKVGDDWKIWQVALGKIGFEDEDELEKRLLNLCLINNLVAMNDAFYERNGSRKWI